MVIVVEDSFYYAFYSNIYLFAVLSSVCACDCWVYRCMGMYICACDCWVYRYVSCIYVCVWLLSVQVCGHVYMCVCAVSQIVRREQRAAGSDSLLSLCELAGLTLGSWGSVACAFPGWATSLALVKEFWVFQFPHSFFCSAIWFLKGPFPFPEAQSLKNILSAHVCLFISVYPFICASVYALKYYSDTLLYLGFLAPFYTLHETVCVYVCVRFLCFPGSVY